MEPKLGVCGLLKASMHIVMHNFCHFLPSLLLLCYVMTVAVLAPSSYFLFTLFILYPAYISNPNPNFSSIPFHFNACRESIKLLWCLFMNLSSVVYIEGRPGPAMAFRMVCGAFVIFLLLELIVGFVYTVFTLRSLATFCPIVEESGACVQAMERWSFSLLCAWSWIAGAMALLIFLHPALGFISLDSRIFSQVQTWSNACGSVGLPALLFLYIRSTQVALYLACKTYHKECKESLITHNSMI